MEKFLVSKGYSKDDWTPHLHKNISITARDVPRALADITFFETPFSKSLIAESENERRFTLKRALLFLTARGIT